MSFRRLTACPFDASRHVLAAPMACTFSANVMSLQRLRHLLAAPMAYPFSASQQHYGEQLKRNNKYINKNTPQKMAENKKIKTALVSVFHKDGLDQLLKKLNDEGVKFLSTGGTQTFIESLGYDCQKEIGRAHV